MCGRASITKTEAAVEERFGAVFQSTELAAAGGSIQNTNISPSQPLPVITNQQPECIHLYRWGLVPHWAKDLTFGFKTFNARMETLLEKPTFKQAVHQRRCLVLMDSFYEWKRVGNQKIPHRVILQGEQLFAVAGLWEQWVDASTGETVHSCTVITQEPNEFMTTLHDRMPAILTPDTERLWIDTGLSATDALQLLQPIDSSLMDAYPLDPVTGLPPDEGPQQLSLF